MGASADDMSRQSIRFDSVLVAALILGTLALVGFTAKAIWDNLRVANRIAALKAAGEPVGLADLARTPAVAPEDNAATYLQQAQSGLAAIRASIDDAYSAASPAEQQAFDAGQPGPVMIAALRAAFAAHPEALASLSKASKCPVYLPPTDASGGTATFSQSMIDSAQAVRGAIRVAGYRAELAAAEGNRPESLDAALEMFRLARLLDGRPTIVVYLVGLATRESAIGAADRVIRAGPLSRTSHEALEQELARHDLLKQYQSALRAERAYGLSSMGELPWSPFRAADRADYLDFVEASLPADEQASLDAADKAEALVSQARPLTRTVAPTLRATSTATARTLAHLRSLRILNALLQSELEGGSSIVQLEELGLPPNALIDPTNDQPLRAKKTASGWVVYSLDKDMPEDRVEVDGRSAGEDA